MCFISDPVLENVVVYFKVKHHLENLSKSEAYLEEYISRKPGRNFFILRIFSCTFTVFPKSGHVNLTGLRRHNQIRPAINLFAKLFKLKRRLSKSKVSNTTYTGKINCLIPPGKSTPIAKLLHDYKTSPSTPITPFKLEFRASHFPSILLKVEEEGTITVFNSGYYIIIGCKNYRQAKKLHKALCVIMLHCWKTGQAGIKCV
jgi:TATA-box binding protein (TBP) (component of TFIID and TFIIIB)